MCQEENIVWIWEVGSPKAALNGMLSTCTLFYVRTLNNYVVHTSSVSHREPGEEPRDIMFGEIGPSDLWLLL